MFIPKNGIRSGELEDKGFKFPLRRYRSFAAPGKNPWKLGCLIVREVKVHDVGQEGPFPLLHLEIEESSDTENIQVIIRTGVQVPVVKSISCSIAIGRKISRAGIAACPVDLKPPALQVRDSLPPQRE